MPGRVSCLAFKANDLSCKEDWFGRLPKRGIQIGLKVHVIILIFSAFFYYEKNKETISVTNDLDKDGVVDSTDRCPNDSGLVSLKGCPDRDNDSIADIMSISQTTLLTNYQKSDAYDKFDELLKEVSEFFIK